MSEFFDRLSGLSNDFILSEEKCGSERILKYCFTHKITNLVSMQVHVNFMEDEKISEEHSRFIINLSMRIFNANTTKRVDNSRPYIDYVFGLIREYLNEIDRLVQIILKTSLAIGNLQPKYSKIPFNVELAQVGHLFEGSHYYDIKSGTLGVCNHVDILDHHVVTMYIHFGGKLTLNVTRSIVNFVNGTKSVVLDPRMIQEILSEYRHLI